MFFIISSQYKLFSKLQIEQKSMLQNDQQKVQKSGILSRKNIVSQSKLFYIYQSQIKINNLSFTMESSKVQIEIKAKGQNSNIEILQTQNKVEIKQNPNIKPQEPQTQKLLMKLYVYGSCQSDQFRHPNKLSESKRPICLTNIQKFDLNENEDEQSQNQKQGNENIYLNLLYKKSVYKVACGGLHTVVLTTDGKAYTFGCNDQGALGRKGPQCIPLEVELDNPVDLVSAGDNHTMFANSVNGIVYFTGNYNYLRGQKMIESVHFPIKFTTVSLDIRNKNQPIQKLVSGANHTCILVNNKIFCRGQPESFTTGRRINQRRKTQNSLTFDGVGLSNVVDVWCGGYHTIAKIKKGNNLFYHAWGKNDQGQLGIGSFKSQAFPVQIKNLRGKNIVKVAAGGFFTLFLTEDGEIMGCGTNQYGQLGLGQDYEYIANQSQSQEQSEQQEGEKQDQLKNHVEKLNINENKPQNESNKNKISSQKTSNMEIQSQKNPQLLDSFSIQNQMISESQQKPLLILNNENCPEPVNLSSSLNEKQVVGDKIQENQSQKKKKYEQKNTYIKSVRHLRFPQDNEPSLKITNIAAGAEFAFAWNNVTQLYSWGFGMNYVLLTGEENEEYAPFKVRNKIINDQIIDDIQAGGQHVAYTAYEKTDSKFRPSIELERRVTLSLGGEKKLSRKRKN